MKDPGVTFPPLTFFFLFKMACSFSDEKLESVLFCFLIYKNKKPTNYLPAVQAFRVGLLLDLSNLSALEMTMFRNLPDTQPSASTSPLGTLSCVWRWLCVITACRHWPGDFSEPGFVQMTAGMSQGSADAEWNTYGFSLQSLWYQFIQVESIDRCVVCGKADDFCFIFSL